MDICPICNRSTVTSINAGSELSATTTWLYCDACELYFLSDIPSPEELQRFYAQSYFAAQRESGFAYKLRAWFSGMRASSQLRYISRHHVAPKKRILEIGSSDGSFLALFKSNGWQVLGLEFSEFGREKAQERHGITLLPKDILDVSPDEYQFDCIAMSHVFEHMPHPIDILEHCRSLLSPEGLVFIEVPHSPLPTETPPTLLDTYLNTTHIYNFRPQSLNAMIARASLSVHDSSRYFYAVPRYQMNRAPLFGSVLMTSKLESKNIIDIAHLSFFVGNLNLRYLGGKDTMMPITDNIPWIGFGDNIRLMSGK